MTQCSRPLDPIDAEAVAAGVEPIFASDAAAHARECPSCQAAIGAVRSLTEVLEGISGAPEAAPPPLGGLADRVLRLRAFSRRERRTYALWNTPVLLTAGLFVAGLVLLSLPGLTASEQASAGAAALAPTFALARSAVRWASELASLLPTGLRGLSEGLRGETALGYAALALLAPLGLGLRRVLVRAPGRK